jgi:hydrogenase maturation protease
LTIDNYQLPRVLIIGIGNTLRRDDGAGCFFAEALAAELARAGVDVTLELRHQLTPELAEDAAELALHAIIFVDASVAVQSPVLTPLVPDTEANTASHSLTPAALLAILRQLYAVDVAGWLVQTPAVDFGHGEGLSAVAQRGVDEAPAVAAKLGSLMTT